eukprot:Awhi_evm1s7418
MTTIDLSGDGNLLKEILREGDNEGSPPIGSTVFVHYVGYLQTGEQFDSSRSRKEEFSFKLGQNTVIKGWDMGVATMSKGERSNLVCSPKFAYGKNGFPPKIPSNATLTFEVELIRWIDGEDIHGDGEIIKKVYEAGVGWESPCIGDFVTLQVEGLYRSKQVFFSQIIEVPDFGNNNLIPKGIVDAVQKMKQKEKSVVKFSLAYGGSDLIPTPSDITSEDIFEYHVSLEFWKKIVEINATLKKLICTKGIEESVNPVSTSTVSLKYKLLPDGIEEEKTFSFWEDEFDLSLEEAIMTMSKGEKSVITFLLSQPCSDVKESTSVEVELLGFTAGINQDSLSSREKIQNAITSKEKGTNFFKQGKNRIATYHYSESIKMVDSVTIGPLNEKEEASKLKILSTLNLSLCQLKLKRFPEVVDNCTIVLNEDGSNVKALYRRAQAYSELGEFQAAIGDLQVAKAKEPTNKAVLAELN